LQRRCLRDITVGFRFVGPPENVVDPQRFLSKCNLSVNAYISTVHPKLVLHSLKKKIENNIVWPFEAGISLGKNVNYQKVAEPLVLMFKTTANLKKMQNICTNDQSLSCETVPFA
jgi:hypothetical protein